MSPDPAPLSVEAVARRPVYGAGTAVAVGSAVAMSFVNARGNARGTGRVRTALGLTSGAVALGFGATGLGVRGYSPVLGAASAAAGAASVWIATRGMVRHHRDLAVARDRERSIAQRAVVSPILPLGREQGAGLSVAVPF
jgi:hypothetical protein